jgi:hypothetical protein
MAFYWRDTFLHKRYWVGTTLGGRLFVNHGLYLRAALEDVGFADERRYAFYHADGDLCLRMWERGWEVADCPRAFVEHFPHVASAVRSSNLAVQQGAWRPTWSAGARCGPGRRRASGTRRPRAHGPALPAAGAGPLFRRAGLGAAARAGPGGGPVSFAPLALARHVAKRALGRPDPGWDFRRFLARVHPAHPRLDDAVLDWAWPWPAREELETDAAYAASPDPLVPWATPCAARRGPLQGPAAPPRRAAGVVHVPPPGLSPGGYSLFSNLVRNLDFLGVPARALGLDEPVAVALAAFRPRCC